MEGPNMIRSYTWQRIAVGTIFIIWGSIMTNQLTLGAMTHHSRAGFDGIHVILPGDYADPSIVRDGDDFYMTHSSYDYFPGLLIWHSKDLVHWKRLTHALHTPIRDVWAPDFVKHDDLFYIYFPAAGTNWVITAEYPAGPWSEPVDLEVGGIDPGHIATPNGERYLHLSGGYVCRLAADGLSVLDRPQQNYDGWDYPSDWVVESFALESPKLVYREPYYYLVSAQGGTAGPSTSHMVVAARATTPTGPWENSPYNPIVRTWDRSERWWSKGHGTIFDDGKGNWYIVYHAYRNGHYPLGRHTLLEPIVWTEDKWFHTRRDGRIEGAVRTVDNMIPHDDDFGGTSLNLQWRFSGLDNQEGIVLKDGVLHMPTQTGNPLILHVVNNSPSFEATVLLEVEGDAEAGLFTYYNESARTGIAVKNGASFFIDRHKRIPGPDIEGAQQLYLRIRQDRYDLSAFVSLDGEQWRMSRNAAEVSSFQHNLLGGFSSLKIAIRGEGDGVIRVKDFRYVALD